MSFWLTKLIQYFSFFFFVVRASLRWFFVHLFWHQRGHQLNHVFTKWKVAERSIDLTFWLNLVIHAHYLSCQLANETCFARNDRERKKNVDHWWNTALFFPSLPMLSITFFFRSTIFFSASISRVSYSRVGYINHLQRMQNWSLDWVLVCFLSSFYL